MLKTILLGNLHNSGFPGNANSIVREVRGTGDVGNAKIKNFKKSAKSKKSDFTKSNFSETDFLIFEAWIAFIRLQKAFIKALIIHCFDLEHHIQIEIDASCYAIGVVFS